MPAGRPPKNGKPGKRWSIYCTAEQIEFLRWWLKHRGEVPDPKQWKDAKPR